MIPMQNQTMSPTQLENKTKTQKHWCYWDVITRDTKPQRV